MTSPATIASLQAVVTAEVRQAVSALQNVATAFEKAGTAAGQSKDKTDSFLTSLIKFEAVQQTVGLLQGYGQAALDAYAQTERLGMSLESLVAREKVAAGTYKDVQSAMAASSAEAQKLLQWTQQLAIASPFSQEGVAESFKMAQSFGFVSDSMDKTQITAKRLTQAMIDFASGSGQTEEVMQRVALAMGQIQAKGKLQGDEMLQLTEAGLNVRQILADAFGKTTDEIVKMQEKGLIPANQAIKAIVESLERDFGGAAKKQAETFTGLLNSLGDLKEVSLKNLFGGLFEEVKPKIVELTNLLGDEGFQGKLKGIGQTAGAAVGLVVNNFGTLVPVVAGATGAWVAYKVIQEATTIATVANTVATAAQSAAETVSLIALEAKTLGLRAAMVASYQYVAAMVAANGAALTLAATLGSVALAVGSVVAAYMKWEEYRNQIEEGSKNLLENTDAWKAAAAAQEEYSNASAGTQSVVQSQVDELNRLKAEQQKYAEGLADELNFAAQFGANAEYRNAVLQDGQAVLEDYNRKIESHSAAIQGAISQEQAEEAALQRANAVKLDASQRAQQLINDAVQLATVTQASAEQSIIDSQAKETQKAKMEVLEQQSRQAAETFLRLNPQIDQAGIASAVAAGKITPLIGQLAALINMANQAKAALAGLAGAAPMNTAAVQQARAQGRIPVEDQSRVFEQFKQARIAQENYTLALGPAAEKQAIFNKRYEQAVKLFGVGSAEAIQAKQALDSFTKSQERAGGGGRGGGVKTAAAEEKVQGRLADIVESGQKRILDIEKKYAELRAQQQQALADHILTSSADLVAQQEKDDLELIGASEEQMRAALPREQAQAKARAKMAEEVQEARKKAAEGNAELADKELSIREKQIAEQQALDEQYYRKQQELAEDPAALEALKTQYDEATDAIKQAADIRAEIAARQAEQSKQKAQEEKDAVIAQAREQAEQVEGASQRQKNAVVTALQEQSQAVGAWADSVDGAVSRVQAAADRAAGAVRGIPNVGGGSTGNAGGGGQAVEARAKGGYTTVGRATLVGEEGPELVVFGAPGYVYPARETRRMLTSGMADGGAILDPSQTNPAQKWLEEQQRKAQQGGGAGNKPGAAPAPIDWAKLEKDYLDAAFAQKKDHFARERALEEEQYQAERALKKRQDAEQKALEKQLQDQFDVQIKALKQAQDRDDETARQRHYSRLTQIDQDAYNQAQRNRAGFNVAAAALQQKAEASQSQISGFWYAVQTADMYDQLQEQNQQVYSAAEQRKEQSQTYLDQDLAANEEAQQAREDALKEAQDAIRDQYLDDLNEKHRLEKQALDDYYNERQSILKDILNAESKVFDSFWEKLYSALPGGEEVLKKLKEQPDTRGQFQNPLPGQTGPGPVYGGPETRTGPGPVYNPNPGPIAPPPVSRNGLAAASNQDGGGLTINVYVDLGQSKGVSRQEVQAIVKEGVKQGLRESGQSADAMIRTRAFSSLKP